MATTNKDEKMKEITDRLQAGLEELFSSEKYAEYLRVMSQFHHYSFNNTLLIAMQKPDAALVAGYHAWEKKFNRHVRKGEKGIQIIAPAPFKEKQEQEKIDPDTGEVVLRDDGQPETEEVTIVIPRFKVSAVFDLSQTDGDPLPELGAGELTASVENYEIFMNAIRSVAPVPIRFDEIRSGAKGYYDNANKEIVIQSGMSELQTMKTAVHETAHAILHDRDMMQEQGIQKDQMTKEVEAESVAFVSLAHFELDTSDYSFPYIAGWSSGRDTKELKSSLDTIRKTSSEIIDGIEASMREQMLERQEAEVSAPIQENSVDIIVDGHEGTWRVIQSQEINGETFFLLESQDYGAEVANVLLNKNRELVAEDLWNGIDYGALEAVKEYFDQKKISYSLTDFPIQERFSIYTEIDPQGKTIFFAVDNVTGGPLLEDGEVKTYEDRKKLMEQVKAMNQEKRPIYRNSATYAHERGEAAAYRFSMQENSACKDAIEKMIRENFDGMHLDPNVVKPVMERFGAERVAYVLANTLQLEDWDGRYAKANKEWAVRFTYPEESGVFNVGRRSFFISSHPAVLDGFTTLFRKEIEARGLEFDGKQEAEKSFIDHFYVAEDLKEHGQLAIKEYASCEEALDAYFALPNDKCKALGIQNTNPMPGSLDFIQCLNGIDTAIMDYSFIEVWNNPEIQKVQAEIERAISLHNQNYELATTKTVAFAVDGEPAKPLEGVVRVVGGFNDWTIDDQQKNEVEMKEAVNEPSLQESARTNEQRREPDGIAVGYDAGFIAVQKADNGYDYTIFNLKCCPIDCGVLEAPDLNINEAMGEVLKGEGLDSFNTWEANYETIMAEADRQEEGQHKTEPTLTYYVTGNVEFPSVGEFHEVETLEEAIKLYEVIPSEPMNAAKGIGINFVDGSEFSGMYPLYQEGKGVSEMSALGEHCMESPLVQRAFEGAKQRFAEPADVHREEDTPTVKSEKEDQTSSPQKAAVQDSGSRKESILNALRDRQAKIKERDKQNREQRSREMKKGDLAL